MSDLQVIAEKASHDESFRELLLACPAQACLEAGIVLPEGVSLLVHQDTAMKRHVVLNDIFQPTQMPEVAKVAERAAADPEFRTYLQENPASAILDELGMAIPSSMKLVILENTPSTIHMVLESVELDDLALAQVAGGKGFSTLGETVRAGNPHTEDWAKKVINIVHNNLRIKGTPLQELNRLIEPGVVGTQAMVDGAAKQSSDIHDSIKHTGSA